MTKDKLLELYNKFKDEEINVSTIRQLRNCTNQDIDYILNSFYPEVMISIITNHTFKLLSLKEQEEISELINDAKTEKIAFEVSRAVCSGIILSSGLTTKIARIINESTTKVVSYVVDTALANSVLVNPNSLEILKIIGSSKKPIQAKTCLEISKNLDVLSNKNVVEIIRITSQIERESQSELFISLAKNKDILSSNLTIKLMLLASKLDDEQIKLLNIIASDKLLEKNKRSLHYIVRMLESPHKIPSIYEQAKTEISIFKQRESTIKRDNDLFWNVYKNNPTEAISLLKENIKDNDEIRTYTKIRRN